MNNELIAALDSIEEEYGISRDVMFDTIEKALYEEYRAEYMTGRDHYKSNEEMEGEDEADEEAEGKPGVCKIEVDRATGNFHIYAFRRVVADEEAKAKSKEDIGLTEAKETDPDCKEGDVIRVELKADGFTRTASKAAKNAIIQKIREEQRNAIFNEYKKYEGRLITGIVQRVDERGDILLNLGKVQAVLKERRSKGADADNETVEVGDRLRVVVTDVENKGRDGIVVRISRDSAEYIKALFTESVTEIEEGIVEIKAIAREAGSRTKIAVYSKNPDIDPVGACVGRNGERVKSIVSNLGNEQIDVINWDENPAQLIVNALSPAKVVSIEAFDEEKTDDDGNVIESIKKAEVVVSDNQLSLAIGRAGQNVRLASKLTEYGIDIKSESQINPAGKSEAEVNDGEDVSDINEFEADEPDSI